MSVYEYAVVPAPKRGLKARGIRGNDARFAYAIQSLMNEYGTAGWEYLRSEMLPCEQRQGLTKRTTIFQHVLVFRKPIAVEQPVSDPVVAPVLEDTPVDTDTPDRVDPVIESKPLSEDMERREPKLAAE
jgi:hypothetical protein